jgi:deazaflavin-dependent oxidoreductase (nitroreductase family)
VIKKVVIDTPPGKILRLGLRLPIWLYRLHLDRLLGGRFLMLIHAGRKSGLPRQAVIEVVQHDKATNTYYVVSAWGEKSDWYQNIRKSPRVTVYIGGHKLHAKAEFIPVGKAIDIMEAYARKHSTAFGELSALFLGERMQPGRDAARRLAEKMPMVAFHVHS